MICRSLVLTLFSVFSTSSVVFSASAQQSRAYNSWLDRPLVNWNRQGTGFSTLPSPSTSSGESALVSRCREQVRQPTSGDKNDATSLFGKRWALTEIGEQRLSADKPYIEFDRQQRRAFGDSGCNRFSGGFEMNGTALKLSRTVSTKRACLTAEANRLEISFLRLLAETTRFEVRGKTLHLYAGERHVLTFISK